MVFPAKALPHPSSNHEALVASLQLGDGVVPVPEKLIKKIWALEYVEMSQLLPEAWIQDNHFESSAHCCHDSGHARHSHQKDVSSIFSWLQCYGTLVSVIAHKFPTKLPQLMAYQSIIIRCYTDYEGDGWLAYDRAFRRKAAYEKCLDWSKLNTSFYQFCLAGNVKKTVACRLCLRQDHKSADCPEIDRAPQKLGHRDYQSHTHDNSSSSRSNSVELCRLFNAKSESRCKYKECKFAHLCKFCKRPHPAADCPGVGKPQKRSRLF